VKTDDDKGAGGKDALKADLAKERDKRQALEGDVTALKEKLVESTRKTDDLAKSILKALGKGDDEDDPVKALEESKKQIGDTEARAKKALLQSRVESLAATMNCHDPATVYAVGNAAGLFAEVEVDLDKGVLTDVKPVIEGLLKDKPFLAKAPGDQPKGGSPPGSDPDPSKPEKAELEELIKQAKAGDEIAAMKVSKNLKRIRELGLKS